jgi:CBS domain-containing protein
MKILKIRNYKFSLLQNPISSVMIKNLITLKRDADISAAIKAMLVHEIDGVLVSDDDRLEGIVTERNILEQIN